MTADAHRDFGPPAAAKDWLWMIPLLLVALPIIAVVAAWWRLTGMFRRVS